MLGEEQVVRAVEILRGTTYDFRVEATTDVVALYGLDVLVAALERLDREIEPGRAVSRPVERSSASDRRDAERRFEALEGEQRTLPGPHDGTRMSLPDVQAALGEFLALALPYIDELNMRQLASALFRRSDVIDAATRPTKQGERILSREETRRCVGGAILNGLRERGFGSK